MTSPGRSDDWRGRNGAAAIRVESKTKKNEVLELSSSLTDEEVNQLAAIRKRLSGPEEEKQAETIQRQIESKQSTDGLAIRG